MFDEDSGNTFWNNFVCMQSNLCNNNKWKVHNNKSNGKYTSAAISFYDITHFVNLCNVLFVVVGAIIVNHPEMYHPYESHMLANYSSKSYSQWTLYHDWSWRSTQNRYNGHCYSYQSHMHGNFCSRTAVREHCTKNKAERISGHEA